MKTFLDHAFVAGTNGILRAVFVVKLRCVFNLIACLFSQVYFPWVALLQFLGCALLHENGFFHLKICRNNNQFMSFVMHACRPLLLVIEIKNLYTCKKKK